MRSLRLTLTDSRHSGSAKRLSTGEDIGYRMSGWSFRNYSYRSSYGAVPSKNWSTVC